MVRIHVGQPTFFPFRGLGPLLRIAFATAASETGPHGGTSTPNHPTLVSCVRFVIALDNALDHRATVFLQTGLRLLRQIDDRGIPRGILNLDEEILPLWNRAKSDRVLRRLIHHLTCHVPTCGKYTLSAHGLGI